PRAAFLIQEAKNKKWISQETGVAMRSLTLTYAGARGEALIELSELKNDLKNEPKWYLTVLLISHYAASLAHEKAKSLIESLQDEVKEGELVRVLSSREEAFLIAYSAELSGAKLSAQNKISLLEEATGS